MTARPGPICAALMMCKNHWGLEQRIRALLVLGLGAFFEAQRLAVLAQFAQLNDVPSHAPELALLVPGFVSIQLLVTVYIFCGLWTIARGPAIDRHVRLSGAVVSGWLSLPLVIAMSLAVLVVLVALGGG